MAKRCPLAHSSFAFARPRPCSSAAGPWRLDWLTIEHLRACLQNRRTRWPTSANPYLLINRSTAGGAKPVSRSYIQETGRRVGITAQDLRADRFLGEAPPVAKTRSKLTHLFGISDPAGAVAVLRTGRRPAPPAPRFRNM